MPELPDNQSELKYAQFGKRLLSVIVELVLWFCIYHYIAKFVQSSSKLVTMAAQFSWFLIGSAYEIYFHLKWGQTLGKMVTRIKVTRVDGSRIGFKQAFMRSSVDIAISLFSLILAEFRIGGITETAWNQLSKLEVAQIIAPLNGIGGILLIVTTAWFFSEAITVLFNKRRRAIHDFIGGTVVLDLASLFKKKTKSILQIKYAKVRIVFLVFLAITIFPAIFAYGVTFVSSNITKSMLEMPTVEKVKLIQSKEYTKMGISNVEMLDNYYKKNNVVPHLDFFTLLFSSCIFLAGLFFKKWGYFILSIYAVLSTLVAFSDSSGSLLHFYASKWFAWYCLFVNFALCCYLFSNNVRRTIFPKDELPKLLKF